MRVENGRVDADIGKPTAAQFRLVAHVFGIGVVIGEDTADMAQPADRAAGDQVADLMPLRVIKHHEGLGYDPARAVALSDEGVDLVRLEGDRLFAKHMLAGLRRLQAPGDVIAGGQRYVNAVDRIGGKQRVVRSEGVRCPEPGGELPRPCLVAAGDGRDNAVAGILHGWKQLVLRDIRR